jgi:formylglycine-generating enzyme required for sulfatase activity
VGDPVIHNPEPRQSAEAPLSESESISVPTPSVKLDEPLSDVTKVETMEFCFVPGGFFVLGSQEDPMAWDGESPPQTCDVPYAYWISRFPVSNGQFREFVADGAYQCREYWLEAEQAGCWKDGLFRNPAADTPSTSPEDRGEPFNLPTHPASGITWYEAQAFSRWMTRKLQQSGILPPGFGLQLPSEIEWEKAARGGLEIPDHPRIARASLLPECDPPILRKNPLPHRRYSWGDQPDPTRANYLDSGLCATSPLGSFPGGASPYGVEDLCGNVWEWTRSQWGSYPYPSSVEERTRREDSSEAGMRTLRGGAFNYHGSLVRCAVRHHHSLLTAYRHIGFRVVVLSSRAKLPTKGGLGVR